MCNGLTFCSFCEYQGHYLIADISLILDASAIIHKHCLIFRNICFEFYGQYITYYIRKIVQIKLNLVNET